MSETARDILAKLRTADEPQLLAFCSDAEGQNAILRNLPCGLLLRDIEEGSILEVNDYALDLFGVQRSSIIGSTLAEAGIGLSAEEQSSMTAPGQPAAGHITDSSGARIPVLVFKRHIRINGSKAEILILNDSTLLGGRRAAEEGFNLFKRVLSESGVPFILSEISGGSLSRDLVIKETAGTLPPEFQKGDLSRGASVADILSPVNAAKLVENAIILSGKGGEKKLELNDVCPIKLYADTCGEVLMTFPAESEERKALRTRKSKLSSGVRRVVLYITGSDGERSGADMLQMIGFQIIEVDKPSSAVIMLEENPGRFYFVVSEDCTDDPDITDLAVEIENSGIGLILVSENKLSYEGELKVVNIPPPLSINLLASAVSEVTG
ncbi:hypothetical protein CSA37_06370 [Candidatus Fermentibacteria bacterium]|nr:MAG: hypothetical protein CSA37_06370 [Candidatus Fermentibacteria bacterium]